MHCSLLKRNTCTGWGGRGRGRGRGSYPRDGGSRFGRDRAPERNRQLVTERESKQQGSGPRSPRGSSRGRGNRGRSWQGRGHGRGGRRARGQRPRQGSGSFGEYNNSPSQDIRVLDREPASQSETDDALED